MRSATFKKIVHFGFGLLLVAAGSAAFGWVIVHGAEKEIARQDAVREYNCIHYGAAINKLAGSDICPPTPHG